MFILQALLEGCGGFQKVLGFWNEVPGGVSVTGCRGTGFSAGSSRIVSGMTEDHRVKKKKDRGA